MDDEARLIDALFQIEAMFAGSIDPYVRQEAERMREEIRRLLHRREHEDTPVEYRFTLADVWSRKLFLALLRRYDLKPYRRRGQRHTTVMVQVPQRFVDETLWPEFTQLSDRLRTFLDGVTDRIVSRVIHTDCSEAEVVDDPGQPPSPSASRLLAAPQPPAGLAEAPPARQPIRPQQFDIPASPTPSTTPVPAPPATPQAAHSGPGSATNPITRPPTGDPTGKLRHGSGKKGKKKRK